MARGEREASTPTSDVAAGRSTDAKARTESALVPDLGPDLGFSSKRPVPKSPFEDEATSEFARPLRPPTAPNATVRSATTELDWLFDVDDDGEAEAKTSSAATSGSTRDEAPAMVSSKNSTKPDQPGATTKATRTATLPSPRKSMSGPRSVAASGARSDSGTRAAAEGRIEDASGNGARPAAAARMENGSGNGAGSASALESASGSRARPTADAPKKDRDSGKRASGAPSAAHARKGVGSGSGADARHDVGSGSGAGSVASASEARPAADARHDVGSGSGAGSVASASGAHPAADARSGSGARPAADARSGSGARPAADARNDVGSGSGARSVASASGARPAADARDDRFGSTTRRSPTLRNPSPSGSDAAAAGEGRPSDVGSGDDAGRHPTAETMRARTDTAPVPVAAMAVDDRESDSGPNRDASPGSASEAYPGLDLDEALRSISSEVRPASSATERRPVTGAQPLVDLPDARPHSPHPDGPALPDFEPLSPSESPASNSSEAAAASIRFDLDPPRPTVAPEPDEARPIDPPAPRRPGGLPRPTGMRSKRREPSDDAPRSTGSTPPPSAGTAVVPKGVVPPPPEGAGEPKALPRTNTAALVALVAADLIQQHERSQRADAPASPDPAPEPTAAEAMAHPAPMAMPTAFPMAAPTPMPSAPLPGGSYPGVEASTLEPDVAPAPRRGALWIGVAAAGLLAVFGWWSLRSSDDDTPAVETSIAAADPPRVLGSDVAAKAEPSRPEPNVPEEQPPQPDPGGGAIAMAAPVDPDAGAEPAPTDAGAEPVPTDAGAEPDEPAPAPAVSSGDKSNRTPRTKKRTTKSAPKATEAAPAPAPAKPAAAKPAPSSAKDLLADAKQALSAGKSGTAYDLAQSAYRKTPSTAALTIMVRAACKSKREAAAKSAFDKVPMSQRSGLRAECRKSGVKLGL